MKHDDTVFMTQCKTLPFVDIRRAQNSVACYHSHSHDEFSFGVIDKGAGLYSNRGVRNRVHETYTVTINPADVHSCNPDEGDWSYRMLFVDTLWFGKVQAELYDDFNTDYRSFHNLLETDISFYRRFNCLYDALLQSDNPLETEGLLIDFVAHCFVNGEHDESITGKVPEASLIRVRDKLLDELEVNLSLDELVQESGLSRYHLIRAFKKMYGLAPHALLLDERIKRAKRLLKQGSSIADTSVTLGFADQAHFQRNFKKRLAMTPKQYQAFFVPS